MKPIIYVSGKYGGDIATNIKAAEAVTVQLMRNGFDVFCPHKNTAGFEQYTDLTYDRFIEMDLNILERCDAIYMMQGWEDSNGAKIEKEYAEEIDLPVILADLHHHTTFTVNDYNILVKL